MEPLKKKYSCTNYNRGGKGTGKLVQSFQLLKQVGHLRVNTENGIQTVKYYIFKYAIEKTRYD